MKLVCLSDTHGIHTHTAVPDGNILIYAGDMTSTGSLDDIIRFNSWLGTLPHKYKIVIAGNHDLQLESEPHKANELLTNAIYLERVWDLRKIESRANFVSTKMQSDD